ncbi:MAG: NFACT RNA binding domain-containing protein [Candidatus Marinimicrobia bacterium]|nr:NFACT RNA binding domain-containing protein [Candidatus Neomarinimicrobiota bacterium]
MFNSWFHIRFLAKYFDKNLKGIVFEKPFTYKKQELDIPFLENINFRSFRFTTRSPLPMFTLEQNRPKPNQKVDVFSDIEGLRLEGVKWHYDDRFMLFYLSSGEYLLFQIFGPNGNVYYLDENYEFKSRFVEKGRKVIPEISSFTNSQKLMLNKKDYQSIINSNTDKSVTNLIKSKFPFSIYQNELIDEICYRAAIEARELVANLSQLKREELYSVFQEILTEIANQNYRIFDCEPPIFAFFKLTSIDAQAEKYSDIIRATEQFIRYYFGWYNFSERKKDLKSKLEKYQNLLGRKIFKQEESLENFPTSLEYRKKADTLLANKHNLDDHIKQVVLPDVHNPSENLNIDLDPELTIAANANKLYEKSKRVDSSKEELKKEYEENKKTLSKVKNYLEQIDEVDTREKLKKMRKTIPERYLATISEQGEEKSRPYRYFTFKGWEVLVGKSARKNDELTFQVANKNDFWLHAQKMTGSHVIVRNPEKKESLPEPVLRRAAGIAAHFSKGKHARAVPVVYTKKKYVWTSKKLPPGKVRFQYESMIVARPFNPAAQSPNF